MKSLWKVSERFFSGISERTGREVRYLRLFRFLLIISLLLTVQAGLSLFQYLQYDKDGYNCVGMSRDAEEFFESLGITVYQVYGNKYTPEGSPFIDVSHRWVLLDFGFVTIPFESTLLLPVSPTLWRHYDDVYISDGYYTHGDKICKNETCLVFEPWR